MRLFPYSQMQIQAARGYFERRFSDAIQQDKQASFQFWRGFESQMRVVEVKAEWDALDKEASEILNRNIYQPDSDFKEIK